MDMPHLYEDGFPSSSPKTDGLCGLSAAAYILQAPSCLAQTGSHHQDSL